MHVESNKPSRVWVDTVACSPGCSTYSHYKSYTDTNCTVAGTLALSATSVLLRP